jgi:glucosamine--fructose-6-phosphate aminotransferase (isomerizing)
MRRRARHTSQAHRSRRSRMSDAAAQHTHHMFDAVHAQPALIEKVLAQRAEIERAADAIAAKERITFVGIGSSLHIARICESWMRELTAGRFWAHYEQSFELLHHPIAFGANDAVIVITHTGSSSASVEALARVRAQGAVTVSITGIAPGEPSRAADFHIETCEQEKAFAYTKSYTTALMALALMIVRIADRKKLLARPTALDELATVPDLMLRALDLKPLVKALGRRVAPLHRIEIFGSGAAWATASEAALKIKEAAYIAAEGFDTEEILHGPFSETDSRAALIGLLTGSMSDNRARQILKAAGELEVFRTAIVTPSANHDVAAEDVLIVPECGEWLSAFVHLVPLQLLTYYLAVERGTNPDTGRMEQLGHSKASKHYKY